MTELLIGAGVVLGGAAVYAIVRKSGKAADIAYQDAILDDAAEWLAKHLEIPSGDVRKGLQDLTDGSDAPASLARLLRVDYEAVKEGPNSIKRTVAVAVDDEGKVVVGKITRELPWDELPGSIREGFIRGGDKTQTFLIYQRRSAVPA